MATFIKRYQSEVYGNYRRGYLKYGLYTGLGLVVYVLIRWAVGSAIGVPEDYGTDLLAGIGIFIGAFLYRKQLPNQKVQLKELLLLGTGIGIIGCLIYGLFLWLYGAVLCPSFVSDCISNRINGMGLKPDTAENILQIKQIQAYSAGDWAFIGAFRTAVMSVIFTFFAALIFRNEQSPVRVKPTKDQPSNGNK